VKLSDKNVLIYAIHRTSEWWRFIGSNIGCAQSTVVTDLQNEGDISITKDFYKNLSKYKHQRNTELSLLTEAQIIDIIARCRVLRWLEPSLATAMIQAMAITLDQVLDKIQPDIIISLPIDRYPTDILDRLAQLRGIPYTQLTASVFPNMSMLLSRGNLIQSNTTPSKEKIQTGIKDLTATTFLPSYVPKKSSFTASKFISTLAYFKVRAIAFKVISYFNRDPLNLHYLDAQPNLGHKCQWRDIRVLNLTDKDWQRKSQQFPKNKRILFGLQLFPEASIDYWIPNIQLIEYEDLIFESISAFSKAGFIVLVKDHPLQFGFRQTNFLDKIINLPNVLLIPYEVPGQQLLQMVDSNFTCTGTLGLQASLLGKTSIVTDSYYTNDEDFVVFSDRDQIADLPQKINLHKQQNKDLSKRRERLVSKLLKGSFKGNLFSFQNFNPNRPSESAKELAINLGKRLNDIMDIH
jgi:capsular polysaccharide biosynthesis protein